MTASPAGFVDSGFEVHGEITVTNPNGIRWDSDPTRFFQIGDPLSQLLAPLLLQQRIGDHARSRHHRHVSATIKDDGLAARQAAVEDFRGADVNHAIIAAPEQLHRRFDPVRDDERRVHPNMSGWDKLPPLEGANKLGKLKPAARSRSTRLATRAGTSSDGTFSEDARPAISARSLDRCRNDSSPT